MTREEKIDLLLNQMTKEERDFFLYKAMHVFVLFKDHPDRDKIIEERLAPFRKPEGMIKKVLRYLSNLISKSIFPR